MLMHLVKGTECKFDFGETYFVLHVLLTAA